MLHFNMPFSLPVIVGRCFTDPWTEDRISDVWIGSEMEPVQLYRHRLPNGQIMEYWRIVQESCSILVVYWSGMPDRLRIGESYDVGYVTLRLA